MSMLSPDRRALLCGLGAAVATPLLGGAADRAAPTWSKLPRWRGFNLLEKYTLARDRPYRAWDFDVIAELGRQLEAQGVGVMIGEWGAYRYTPHPVGLAWMESCLRTWREQGRGWCLWNLRGDFGPFDSGRTDVAYADFRGEKLDREMLALLRRY